MPVQVQWLNAEQTALLFEYVHPWTWDDLREARDQRDAMLSEVSYPVTVIIDLTGFGQLPPNIIGGIRTVWQRRHTRTGRVILVGLNPGMLALSHVLMKVYPVMTRQTIMVATREEALALVETPSVV